MFLGKIYNTLKLYTNSVCFVEHQFQYVNKHLLTSSLTN